MALTEAMYDKLTAALTVAKVALYVTAPDGDDPGEEVTGGAYARQNVTFAQDESTPSLSKNNAAVSFAGMPECDVVAVGVWDAAQTNLLMVVSIPTKHFGADDTGVIPAGQLSMAFN